jgi:predicted NBD/HSP70 family sugar kinase
MRIAAGVDLGGTAVNYTFVDREGHFLIDGLCEHPARSKEGPAVCLQQITDGLEIAARQAGVTLADVAMIGLDTPGPASADGVLSVRGSTNFVHADWAGFDLRHGLEEKVGKPVVYLNDGNAAALWGHVAIFGPVSDATSISAIIGTGLGGGVITGGNTVVRGRRGFGGELGHVLVPYQSIAGIEGLRPDCNCLRTGDLESLCSLTAIERTILPYFLARDPHHELHKSATPHEAAKRVRSLAERGDALCRRVFQVQAHALGLFFDEMVNVFDPDAFIVGGGAIETGEEFQQWFLDEVRRGMPTQRSEQAGIPIHIMPNGDSAGARGAAIEAMGRMRTVG